MKTARMLRALGALGAVSAIGVLAQGGAVAGAAGESDVAVIKAKANLEKKKLFFKGPDTVEPGQKLKFKVTTDVAEVGPHTLSLVRKNQLPQTKKEMKGCFAPGKICYEAAMWHEIEFPDNEEDPPIVHRPKVKAGKKGWDRLGNLKREGDSIYLENKGESFTQKVSADDGAELFYMCIVHSEMQGKVKVEG